jgi:hypothetical protein
MYNFKFLDPKELAPEKPPRMPSIQITASRLYIPKPVQEIAPSDWSGLYVRLGYDADACAIGIQPDNGKGKMVLPVKKRTNGSLAVAGLNIIVSELKIDLGKSGCRRIGAKWDAEQKMLIAVIPQELRKPE